MTHCLEQCVLWGSTPDFMWWTCLFFSVVLCTKVLEDFECIVDRKNRDKFVAFVEFCEVPEIPRVVVRDSTATQGFNGFTTNVYLLPEKTESQQRANEVKQRFQNDQNAVKGRHHVYWYEYTTNLEKFMQEVAIYKNSEKEEEDFDRVMAAAGTFVRSLRHLHERSYINWLQASSLHIVRKAICDRFGYDLKEEEPIKGRWLVSRRKPVQMIKDDKTAMIEKDNKKYKNSLENVFKATRNRLKEAEEHKVIFNQNLVGLVVLYETARLGRFEKKMWRCETYSKLLQRADLHRPGRVIKPAKECMSVLESIKSVRKAYPIKDVPEDIKTEHLDAVWEKLRAIRETATKAIDNLGILIAEVEARVGQEMLASTSSDDSTEVERLLDGLGSVLTDQTIDGESTYAEDRIEEQVDK